MYSNHSPQNRSKLSSKVMWYCVRAVSCPTSSACTNTVLNSQVIMKRCIVCWPKLVYVTPTPVWLSCTALGVSVPYFSSCLINCVHMHLMHMTSMKLSTHPVNSILLAGSLNTYARTGVINFKRTVCPSIVSTLCDNGVNRMSTTLIWKTGKEKKAWSMSNASSVHCLGRWH